MFRQEKDFEIIKKQLLFKRIQPKKLCKIFNSILFIIQIFMKIFKIKKNIDEYMNILYKRIYLKNKFQR